MTPGMPENDQQVSLKHLEQWCYYTQLDTVHNNTGFPHNFDLEIPGHFQDFSRTFQDIFQDIFQDFGIAVKFKNIVALPFCCAIHNIITVYNTEQVHRRKVWVPTAGRGFGGITPEKNLQFYVEK